MAAKAGRRYTAHWHADQQALRRMVMALIESEVSRLRPDGTGLLAPPWDDKLLIDERGLGLDSLERLSVASALNEALHLHESELADLLLVRRRIGEWLNVARQSLRRFDSLLTFRTSGSSAEPKRCSHSLAGLEQESSYLAHLLPGTQRVLSAVPAHHLYGFLFSVMLPGLLPSRPPVLDVRQVTPQSLQHQLRPGDLVVSHPAHWELMATYAAALPSDVTGVSSTAALSERTAHSLTTNGLSRLLQVYGSSETGGVGWREAPSAPYRLFPYWARDPADHARILRQGQGLQPRACDLQDELSWSDDRSFFVRGRRDAAVQIGGSNVYPEAVRSILLTHPRVADAAVRLMTLQEGRRFKAFIVPKPGTNPVELTTQLMDWANARLSVPERPRSFTVGNVLPVDEHGKLCDWTVEKSGKWFFTSDVEEI